jgi:hypothetical protein
VVFGVVQKTAEISASYRTGTANAVTGGWGDTLSPATHNTGGSNGDCLTGYTNTHGRQKMEPTLQGYANPFMCECGKVKSDPHTTHCRDCQIALIAAQQESDAYKARQLAKARAAIWARAMFR